MMSKFLTDGMYLSFCIFYVLPRASYGYIIGVGSFPVWSGGSPIIFQFFRCRNLALNRDVYYISVRHWGFRHRGHLYALLYACTSPYVCIPTYVCTPPYTLYICMFSHTICSPCVMRTWRSFGDIITSVRHFCVCQYIHCLSIHNSHTSYSPSFVACFLTGLDASGCLLCFMLLFLSL